MPRDASVFFGTNGFDQGVEPGDIVFGHYFAVPPARPPYAQAAVGERILVDLTEEDGSAHQLPATHWGEGVVLLDRDHEILEPLFAQIFESKYNTVRLNAIFECSIAVMFVHVY